MENFKKNIQYKQHEQLESEACTLTGVSIIGYEELGELGLEGVVGGNAQDFAGIIGGPYKGPKYDPSCGCSTKDGIGTPE